MLLSFNNVFLAVFGSFENYRDNCIILGIT